MSTQGIGNTSTSLHPAGMTDEARLKKVCQQFEGQFFAMMLQEMRKTVPTDPVLGDDAHEQEVFQGMLDDNVSQEMAKHSGANDLAAQMYKQLSRALHPAVQPAPGPLPIEKPTLAIPLVKIPAASTDDDNKPNQ